MKSLALILGLFLVWTTSDAASVRIKNQEGRVTKSGKCANKWVFTYFDGERVQHLCIGSSHAVPLTTFIRLSASGSCRRHVRVNEGVVEGNTLFAEAIEEGAKCNQGDK